MNGLFWSDAAHQSNLQRIARHKGISIEEVQKRLDAVCDIVATTCPYGDLNAHLNDTANCELGDECVHSGRPVTHAGE